jgi:hypothetical protein
MQHLRKGRRHRCWIHGSLKKENQGAYITLLSDLRLEEGLFWLCNYIQMSPEDFEILLDLVLPFIEKKYTSFKDMLPVDKRLMVTLQFLATAYSYITFI